MENLNKMILSKIVGSTFTPYGQQAIKELKEGDRLIWEREPENKYDPYAIGIYNMDQLKLGYIPKETAKDISLELDNQTIKAMKVEVNEVTGIIEKNVGCNIIISLYYDLT